jgi:3,4-dihydroxy 2-butanone 4-phosphate synthase/GTP cyclohydrolase II
MPLSPTHEIIEDIRQGKMVILMDDEDRENEGDLILASQWVQPDDINFMAKFGRGLICMTVTEARCKQLHLPLMVSDTNDQHGTNFTVSIEAARGVTTGISAADRAVTVRAAVAADAKPEDIVQPGHIFPIMAQPGGVLARAGHTEAGCDLARLAGLEPSSVIVEILKEDGTMARRDDLEIFAAEHGLKMGTIADLIEYRSRNEKTVEHVTDCDLPTEFGDFHLHVYKDTVTGEVHFAATMGEITPDDATLVRVHMRNDIGDILGSNREGMPLPVRKAMKRISDEGRGVLVLLRKQDTPQELIRWVRNCHLQDEGATMPESSASSDLRVFGVGAQILLDLGVKRMRVIGAKKRILGLSGFGLEVEDYVSVD